MTRPPYRPADPAAPEPVLVVRTVPAAVAASYRPRVSVLGVLLLAWTALGTGLVVTGRAGLGTAALIAGLVVLALFVRTVAAWMIRIRPGPALVLDRAGIALARPNLTLPWSDVESVEVLPDRGWLRTPALVLRPAPGGAARTPRRRNRIGGAARWRRDGGLVIDADAFDTPVHTIVAAVATASGGSVRVPTTGLR